MKKVKPFLILIGIAIFLFCAYIINLRILALKGNKVFEYRCTNVNPHLINSKNSFLDFADYLKNPDKYNNDLNKATAFFDNYISEKREYVVEEGKWLEMDKKFINRVDFNLIEPWYLKKAGNYQLEMYQGSYDEAKLSIEIWDNKVVDEVLEAKRVEAMNRRDNAEEKYFNLFDEASEISDWRKIFSFIGVPEGCNEENMTIPNTYGSIDWGDELSPTPTKTEVKGLLSQIN